MSEEKLDQPNVKLPDGKKDKKEPKEKKKRKNPILKWFREMRSELKKVVWPTKKQIINNTLIALAIIIASSAVVWVVDKVGITVVDTLIQLGGR
jgi:preprotein translocase subunit SecE